MKRLIMLGIAVLIALTVGAVPGLAAADGKTATNLFIGEATTGVGQPMPVDINPADMVVREDGAIGLGYTYEAVGRARGGVRGSCHSPGSLDQASPRSLTHPRAR